ncbi:intradiol ring-cleavage dioxygenase [Noviherbaspirillum denitrificans]|uniref:Twin-arginine translocation pathway signal protein n=1 Tax=Noviherbaspirillum denitrificans TaxID=1968433 RepID=A0A254TBY0_9BURK|nr:intradiol ring-cleavage dioxygenase [Noviherbaspirillum denitrificans]OWW20144.1 twin-arginine translocation pathway signal protein [Noviherbaspirillum denitrificans]
MDKGAATPEAGISRRDALLILGASMITVPAIGQAQALMPACVVTPEQTEGPYFSDFMLNRSDIRSDPGDGIAKPGIPLALVLRVRAVEGSRCTPLPGAIVDVWHCDATGAYSDALDSAFDTRGKKFLRGYQVTDSGGAVRFTTIYPGWYPGRAVHVHFKVRTKARSGRDAEFTSQLYFPDSINERVLASAPYARPGRQGQRNENDGLYRRGGRFLMADIAQAPGGGFNASFDIGLNL